MLQTALCYIEALRPGIPELVNQEQTGEGICGKIDHGVRVLSQDDPRLFKSPKEVDIDELIDPVHFASSEGQIGDDTPPTMRMLHDSLLTMPDTAVSYQVENKLCTSSEDIASPPLLPSPLLCPLPYKFLSIRAIPQLPFQCSFHSKGAPTALPSALLSLFLRWCSTKRTDSAGFEGTLLP